MNPFVVNTFIPTSRGFSLPSTQKSSPSCTLYYTCLCVVCMHVTCSSYVQLPAVVFHSAISRQTKLSFCRPRPAKQQCKDNTEPHSEDVQASEELSYPEAPSVESKRHALPTEMSAPSGYTTACHKGDIGFFFPSIGRINRLSDTDKYALIKEPYVPPPIYTFQNM